MGRRLANSFGNVSWHYSFVRPVESRQLRVAFTSLFGMRELSCRVTRQETKDVPACGREDGGSVIAKGLAVMVRTG